MFFHQGKSAYNIVQFGVYAIITTNILTLSLFDQVFRRKPAHLLVVSFLLLLFSLPTSVKSFLDYKNNDHIDTISYSELEALFFLKNSTARDSIILTHPDTHHTSFALIPGISARTTYFSSETFALLLGIDPSEKLQASHMFFNPQTTSISKLNFLNNAKINYIYLNYPYTFSQQEIKDLDIKLIFTNQQVDIYQTQSND